MNKTITAKSIDEAKQALLDNLNLDMYTDSIEGVVPRKKIRVRNYPNNLDNQFYLEVKKTKYK